MKPAAAIFMDDALLALGVSVRKLRRDADAAKPYAVYLFAHSMGGGRGQPRSWTQRHIEEAQRLREACNAKPRLRIAPAVRAVALSPSHIHSPRRAL